MSDCPVCGGGLVLQRQRCHSPVRHTLTCEVCGWTRKMPAQTWQTDYEKAYRLARKEQGAP